MLRKRDPGETWKHTKSLWSLQFWSWHWPLCPMVRDRAPSAAWPKTASRPVRRQWLWLLRLPRPPQPGVAQRFRSPTSRACASSWGTRGFSMPMESILTLPCSSQLNATFPSPCIAKKIIIIMVFLFLLAKSSLVLLFFKLFVTLICFCYCSVCVMCVLIFRFGCSCKLKFLCFV